MTRFFTTFFLTLLTCFQVAQADVTITFNVNMSSVTVSPSGVYIAGGSIGNPGDNPLTDPDGDGIYSGTITVPDNFFSYYTILNGNCGDYSCKEQIGGQPCSDPGNFNDRQFQAGTTDMTISTCFGLCTDEAICSAQSYSVTFQVDMNNVGPNPAGVNMGSSIDGWSGNISMSDPDGDGIYSYTTDLVPGFYEYKFINGPGWCCGEIEFVPLACDVTGGAFQNRGITVLNQDVVIPPVCFSTCSEECPEIVDVTFQVNMALQDTHPDGVNLGTNIDGWSGNIEMFQVGGTDVWEVTLSVAPGDYEFKFINGPGWGAGPDESVPDECNVVLGSGFQNRGVSVPSGISELVLPPVCFGLCDNCPIVGCMDPDAHNYRPRAEVQKGIDSKTFYWDDVSFINEPSASSPYCGTQVKHFAGDAGSDVLLTINTVDANTMEVIVESPDPNDPVDVLVIPGGSGAAFSPDDLSVPGQIKKTLTWANPPADVFLNVLWSKQSFPGNWQLSTNDISIPFGANCTLGSGDVTTIDVLLDFETGATLIDFGGAFSAVVEDPTNPANTVVETNKVAPAETFAGTFTDDLATPIPFTISNKKVSVRVWSPEAGVPVLLKVENSANGAVNSEVLMNTTVAMQWETLVFDFANGNIPINVNETYDRVVIFFDFGIPYTGSECETCDDGILNGDELGFITLEDGSTVECGGKKCVPCASGCTDEAAHNYDADAVVDDGSCETCSDGEMNGDETDVDCGGSLCAPCNDMCHDAFNIVCGDTVTGDISTSTDTDPGLDCGDVTDPAQGVWYRFEGTGDDITLLTDHAGTDYDTNLQVFTGSCGALTCVAGDEDGANEDFIDYSSLLTFESVVGTTYYIYLSGYNGEVGAYEMTLDCYTPVEVVVTAILGVPSNGAGTGSIGISTSGGDTSCGPLTYSWEGPSDYTATTASISGLTEVGEYTLTVTDCQEIETVTTVSLPLRGRTGRGRRGKAAILENATFNAQPNPFSQSTNISFSLTAEEQISLDIFDVTGKQVANLFNGIAEAETNYQFQFGNELPAGTYVATLTTASGDVQHLKLIVTH